MCFVWHWLAERCCAGVLVAVVFLYFACLCLVYVGLFVLLEGLSVVDLLGLLFWFVAVGGYL